MSELISVIIPVYNHANTLKKSIASLFKQTYQPIEIIVVNDGSTDNYNEVKKEIQKEFKSKDISLQFLEQKNGGAPSARNKGFRNSKGEYIIFWDADIIGKPEMLERMHLALQQGKSASYAYSQFLYGWKKIKSQQFNIEDLKKNNYICTMSLIRREDFPFFDEKLKRFQDWDLWLTMMKQGKKGIFIPQVLFKGIVGLRNGISSWIPSFVYKLPFKTKKVKKYEEAKKIIVEKHKLYGDKELEKEIKDIILKGKNGKRAFIHAKGVRKYLLQLNPQADYALQISALAHDIERATDIISKKKKEELRKKDYTAYKREHSIVGAKITKELLTKHKYDKKFIQKVEYLITNHEFGGDIEVNYLRDADSLSFFADNAKWYLEHDHTIEQLKDKLEFMYSRAGKKAQELIRGFKFEKGEVSKVFRDVIER